MAKTGLKNIKQACFPRKVLTVKLDKRPVAPELVSNISSYFLVYIIMLATTSIAVALIETQGYGFTTYLTSVISCLNNVGPGLEGIGAADNYNNFHWLSKLILSFDMLAGRLEIIPMLLLFYPKAWELETRIFKK